MAARLNDSEDYELVTRKSFESDEIFDLDGADFQSSGRTARSYATRGSQGLLSRLRPMLWIRTGYQKLPRQTHTTQIKRRRCGNPHRKCYVSLQICIGFVVVILALTSIFNPSYTHPPQHYQDLRKAAQASDAQGRANPEGQKTFIAASIYDRGGSLLSGPWGEALLSLIEILGTENVYLSIYENDVDQAAMTAQSDYEKRVKCKHSLVYDEKFTSNDVAPVHMPDGSARVKRIAFLAEVRNRALKPMYEEKHGMQYDKILYLNDVIFDPIEAAQLLLSTNIDETGHTSYRAACAVDFINPFKFYDTFATRDAEGFSLGLPFFPWFSGSGQGLSRQDVLQEKEAVRVKSCWGGMVAFDAKPFFEEAPLSFRATEDLYWDASECCLIHADLLNHNISEAKGDAAGVYMNPFIRVAYGYKTLRWLRFTRRFERLYSIPHSLMNKVVGLPWFNPRRTEVKGKKVEEQVWVPDANLDAGGSFQTQVRTAMGDGYCGRRGLQLIKESPREGEKNWENMPVPPDRV